jgi:signal transduction histidine kinase
MEVEVVAADGTLLTCNACGTLFDLDGTETLLVEFRDVTQIRRLQKELARADHLITLGTMNAGIAHEFKNRLAPLRAVSQIITMRASQDPTLARYSPLIIEEVDRLASLVRDILDYARPQEPRQEPVDLVLVTGRFVAEFSEEFAETLRGKGITCGFRHPGRPVLADIDPEQLRRIFLNLFKNSLEACGGSDTPSSVEVRVQESGAETVLTVVDTGCGMSAETADRVFDPFYTTKGSRGTGLGMCIVRSLVEANRGTIEVQSETGRGTTIVLRFPRAETPGDVDPERRRAA